MRADEPISKVGARIGGDEGIARMVRPRETKDKGCERVDCCQQPEPNNDQPREREEDVEAGEEDNRETNRTTTRDATTPMTRDYIRKDALSLRVRRLAAE